MTSPGHALELDGKIVFAGPPGSGKSTALRAIHSRLDPDSRGELLAPAESDGRTIFFDLLTIELGTIGDRPFRLQLLTAPGEAGRTVLRRTVLRGADAVVFVADSAPGRLEANRAALAALEDDLAALRGAGAPEVPVLMLYNKRDVPGALEPAELERVLNPAGRPWFASSAALGEGLVEPLAAAVRYVAGAVA